MYIRYFGFLLLIWFPGALHAQSTTQSCSAPSLVGGFFVPKQVTYSNGTTLSYTCYDGRKPAMKGWWATSTCENGKWSHQPRCIESTTACTEPPKVPHAVIIHQAYQEVFAIDSEVVYECEDGYTIEGAHTNKSIFCMAGTWTEGPTCRPSAASGSNEREIQTQTISNAYCSVNTAQYPDLIPDGVIYLKYDDNVELKCRKLHWYWTSDHYSLVQCINGSATLSKCCGYIERQTNNCEGYMTN